MDRKLSRQVIVYYLFSFALLLCAYLFYLEVRGFDPVTGEIRESVGGMVSPLIAGSLTTFLHVLAFSLLSYALLAARQHLRIPVLAFWAITNLILELLQLPVVKGAKLVSGTFDPFDIAAIALAGVVFYVLTQRLDNRVCTEKNSAAKRGIVSSAGLSVVGIGGVLSILASGYSEIEPVYMSYEELRGPLKIESNRPLLDTGKIYIYQNLLLVSEPNKGIHIYDNTDPTAPIHKAFLNIPGNLDIAVRSGILYADSFIDLIVVDINDLNNIMVAQRHEWVFPYNAYQALPENSRVFYSYDKDKGVVIGARKKKENTRGSIEELFKGDW